MARPAPPATPCMTAPSLLTAVCPFSLPAVAMASTPSLVSDDGAARPGPFPDRWRAASPHGPVAVRPAPPHGSARSSGGSGPAPVASPVVIVSRVHRRSPYRHRRYGYHVNFSNKMLLQVRADGRLQWWRRLVLSSSTSATPSSQLVDCWAPWPAVVHITGGIRSVHGPADVGEEEVLWLTLFHQPDASNLIVLELQQADD